MAIFQSSYEENKAIGEFKIPEFGTYFEWAKQVVDAGLRGVNSGLEAMFDDVYFQKEWIK